MIVPMALLLCKAFAHVIPLSFPYHSRTSVGLGIIVPTLEPRKRRLGVIKVTVCKDTSGTRQVSLKHFRIVIPANGDAHSSEPEQRFLHLAPKKMKRTTSVQFQEV